MNKIFFLGFSFSRESVVVSWFKFSGSPIRSWVRHRCFTTYVWFELKICQVRNFEHRHELGVDVEESFLCMSTQANASEPFLQSRRTLTNEGTVAFAGTHFCQS